MASAYAVSECMDIKHGGSVTENGRGDGESADNFVPQFLVQNSSGNFFVPSGMKLGFALFIS